ncbi:hypothetical protein [Candidatus Poriferisodalis sp.]|uniref:hypothetical protein n=1 Tax=Candidatus Poriferisodalis sp. TaxID=3101277 RepID=UPI003D0C8523
MPEPSESGADAADLGTVGRDDVGPSGDLGLADVRDELPAEGDRGFVGAYKFPDNSRRRITGALCFAVGVWAATAAFAADSDAVLLNGGVAVGGIALALAGLYQFAAGRRFGVNENEALVAAVTDVGFAVGHASAQLGWRGWLSRPTWRVLVYSAEDPPERRGLVMVDALNGAVLERWVEDNPEDWIETAPQSPSSDEPTAVQPEAATAMPDEPGGGV